MLAEYHYDQITAILKQRGMGHYGESHEGGRAFIGDGMEAKRTNDVPMSAMWTQQPGVNAEQHGYNADIRESASVAHLYGKTYVAAESLTAGSGAWAWSPGDPQAHRRQGAGDGPEPVRHPHVGPPAAPGQGAGPQPRPLRSVVHAQRDLGGAGEGLGDVSRAQLLHAAAGPLRGRRRVLLRRGHERDRALRRQGSAGAGRLQLRLRQRRCARAPAVGRGRSARDAERHALPRAGARSEQPAHVAARAAQDSRPRRGRRGRGRTEAPVDARA